MPVTKHNWLVTDAQDIPRVVREAFHVATTGRPGPVLVDFPKDVANATMEWYWPEKVDLPGYKPNVKGHPKQIKDAARLISEARQPVIYAGGGILKAGRVGAAARARGAHRHPGRHDADGARRACPTSIRCASACRACTATTPRSRRCRSPTCSSRSAPASTTASPANPATFAPNAKVIHVDIDPAELGKVRRPDVPIVGDCKIVITELIKAVKAEHAKHGTPDISRVDRARSAHGRSSSRSSTSRTTAGR